MSDYTEQKNLIRRRAYRARAAQPHKNEVSRLAIDRLLALSEYERAKVVLWYVDCRSELRTRPVLACELAKDKRIVVPFCTTDVDGENVLGLWRLQSMDELVIGRWQIMEPPSDRWNDVGRTTQPEEIDFAVVPGVAFDREGGRIGSGQGYYDRLLKSVRPDCCLAAPCYESQLVAEIPMQDHDVCMDKVVTERCEYEGRGRQGSRR